MPFPRLAMRVVPQACLVGLVILLAPTVARAVGEEITDVRVMGNQRTEEATIRSMAGVSIGDTLDADTLDTVRERLNTAGLFSDVNVWWEAAGSGVRINIAVKDKFPWAPVPTGSWSANNKALGLVFVHGNLFGRGKQMVLGGRLASVDSGVALAYRDPSLFGSWIYWQMQGYAQRLVLPEYLYDNPADPTEVRQTRLTSYGFEATTGIAWFRRVKTQVGWKIEHFNLADGSVDPMDAMITVPQATQPGTIGVGRAALSFDFRAREFSVMSGAALSGSFDYASTGFGSDFKYWRAGVSWEQGIRILRRHNFVYFANANLGKNLPFFAEAYGGGGNLRGYLFQQFRGDTQVSAKAEYHFPLFSIASLDFRALAFYDFSAVWYREAAPTTTVVDGSGRTYLQRDTPDLRTFPGGPNGVPFGFSFDNSVHNSVGGGLRFFLRSVAVPLVGFDAGYGIEARNWRFILIVGA